MTMQFSKVISALLRSGQRQVEPLFSAVPVYGKFQYNRRCSVCTWSYLVNGRLVGERNFLQRRIATNCIYRVRQSSTNPSPHFPEVQVNGNEVPEPFESFTETNFQDSIILELQRTGFTKPTTIQGYCLPVAMSGRDVVGIGQTGSGKTLAYILPALAHLSENTSHEGVAPQVLVMAPTRELAQQIFQVSRQFGEVCGIYSTCLFGGVSKVPQIRNLQRGVQICIGTPGRLIDLMEMKALDLSKISYLVLDEADRMLDMGFEPQIRKIIERIPPHQTLMWSATWPKEIRTLAKDYLKDFIQINVGSGELRANPNIKQVIEICIEGEKEELLVQRISEIVKDPNAKLLIFAQMKREVDQLTRMLVWKKFQATCIHGDKSQMERDFALRDFRDNRKSIMIATDVAARGLDITDITHVINYSFPNSVEDYVHRIGRTARGEKSGSSLTFFTLDNSGFAKELIEVLRDANQQVDPELQNIAKSVYSHKPSSYQRQNRYNARDKYFNKPRNSYSNSQDSFGSKENFDRRNSNRRRNESSFHDDMDEGYGSNYTSPTKTTKKAPPIKCQVKSTSDDQDFVFTIQGKNI